MEQNLPFLESSKAYLSVSVDDRQVSRMTVIAGLVGKFTKWVAFPSGTEWMAYSRGVKRSVPVCSLREEYCTMSKVNLKC